MRKSRLERCARIGFGSDLAANEARHTVVVTVINPNTKDNTEIFETLVLTKGY
jgi:hypothetical protein